MKNDLLFLKPNIQVEPLFDSWYAWAHLISPATAARNITERHLTIMDSYIGAPELHAAAVKNPKLLGGPFIDYGGERVDEESRLCASKPSTGGRAFWNFPRPWRNSIGCSMKKPGDFAWTRCMLPCPNPCAATWNWSTTSTTTHGSA